MLSEQTDPWAGTAHRTCSRRPRLPRDCRCPAVTARPCALVRWGADAPSCPPRTQLPSFPIYQGSDFIPTAV